MAEHIHNSTLVPSLDARLGNDLITSDSGEPENDTPIDSSVDDISPKPLTPDELLRMPVKNDPWRELGVFP